MDTENIMYGHHSCVEFIKKSPGRVNRILLSRENYRKYAEVARLSQENRIPFDVKERYYLDKIAGGGNHQGIVIYISPYEYYDALELIESASANPLFILLDGIEDPQNLGNIIRTSAAAGVEGIVLENRRSAAITSSVMKVSSGGLSSVKIARVTNLKNLFVHFNEKDIPIISTLSAGQNRWTEVDYSRGAAFIFGSEGKGIRRILVEKSDYTIRIPVQNEMNSLNVAVAVGVIIYEALRQQGSRL